MSEIYIILVKIFPRHKATVRLISCPLLTRCHLLSPPPPVHLVVLIYNVELLTESLRKKNLFYLLLMTLDLKYIYRPF